MGVRTLAGIWKWAGNGCPDSGRDLEMGVRTPAGISRPRTQSRRPGAGNGCPDSGRDLEMGVRTPAGISRPRTQSRRPGLDPGPSDLIADLSRAPTRRKI